MNSLNNIESIINSLKGISGTGGVLGSIAGERTDTPLTLEPGDFVDGDRVTTIPVAHDNWYLYAQDNFLAKYYGTPDNYRDYTEYLSSKMSFLLEGLKPIKAIRDLKEHLLPDRYISVYDLGEAANWKNNGIYWINTIYFELWRSDEGVPSGTPIGYAGHLSFPIGQLGTMDIIAVFGETWMTGYQFTAANEGYWEKPVPVLEYNEVPIEIDNPEMFPPLINRGCYGRHLIEHGYLPPDKPIEIQNSSNSSGFSAYAPVAKKDVELFPRNDEDNYKGISPKLWMRYWIHRDDIMPVPGEFIGILCKPIVTPPHVWWFQESFPLLYAGNWMETTHLTSGVITEAADEEGVYAVKVQGCIIRIEATDFYPYSVGDRVAILKTDKEAGSFKWSDQLHLGEVDEGHIMTNYVIIPATYYKIKT